MKEITNQDQENLMLGISEVECGIDHASDLALCLSIAANSGEMELGDQGGTAILGGALRVLHEYLSFLYEKQEESFDRMLSANMEKAEMEQDAEEGSYDA
ncbi:MAG: hypothetical protein LUE29_08120 [Lachnospiraceae bacterium]|nr:hypothetical protein [Lachnospiraceae bacterium]